MAMMLVMLMLMLMTMIMFTFECCALLPAIANEREKGLVMIG